MPAKKHLRGASDKEQRQYEHIKESAQRSGRYGGRAKDVAARTVMKQKAKKKRGGSSRSRSSSRGKSSGRSRGGRSRSR